MAVVLTATPSLSAQEKESQRTDKADKTGTGKKDQAKGHGPKAGAVRSDPGAAGAAKGTGGEPDADKEHPAETAPRPKPPPVQDDVLIAAQRALATLKTAIKNLENAGADTTDLQSRSDELSAHLSRRDKPVAQIAAEASLATMDAVDQFSTISSRPADRALPGAHTPRATDQRESTDFDPQTSHDSTRQLSLAALVISILAIISTYFVARAAVRKTLRKAGLL